MWGPGSLAYSTAVFWLIYVWLADEPPEAAAKTIADTLRLTAREGGLMVFDVPSDVTNGGYLTLVVPLAMLAIVLLWGWSLRRRVP